MKTEAALRVETFCTNLQNRMTSNPRGAYVCLARNIPSRTDAICHTNSVTLGKRRNIPGDSDAVLRRHISDIAFRHAMSSEEMTSIIHAVFK